MEGEVYPVAEVGAARELGWAREVAGVLVARGVVGVMTGKMKNEGLDRNMTLLLEFSIPRELWVCLLRLFEGWG